MDLANSALAGSASAVLNSVVPWAFWSEEAILSGTVVNKMDKNTAVPSVPPIWRVKVAEDVATPMRRGDTAFCTARVRGWKLKPRPRPKKTSRWIWLRSTA